MKSAHSICKGQAHTCRKFSLILSVIFCLTVFSLTGCGSSGSDVSDDSGYDFSYSDRDLDPSYDKKSATAISLSDENVLIDTEGTYILSGSLSDGQIIIDTPDNEKVQLVLDGINLASSESAPLHIKECDKVFITLAEGSTNTLTGPSEYSEAASEENIDGVIFSKGDLTINGSGSLSIKASSGHGIVSKDDLIITGGNISVTAAKDGLQGKDCIKIKDGNITVTADNDGIRSSNTEDEYRGFISIDGGSFNIDAGYDGLQAATLLRVADGDFDITTGGGSQNASTQDDWGSGWGGGRMMGGQPGDMMHGDMGGQPDDPMDGMSDSSSEDDTISAKGLKSGLILTILGGNINIDSSDDSVHCNGDVTVKGGTINAASGDDGFHADSDLVVKDGAIIISKSYEGLEGNTVTVDGGNVDIVASDDGLNAAGGSDGSSVDGRPGENQFAVDESAFIAVNGGTIDIAASGDGIDSNGSLDITGGTTTVTCPTTGDTAVLDYESEGNITGGTFIGTGAVQMAQTFSSSEQGVVAVSVGNQSAGTTITLKGSDGKTVVTHKPDKDFAVVILSSPGIVSGETYTISVGSTLGEITAD